MSFMAEYRDPTVNTPEECRLGCESAGKEMNDVIRCIGILGGLQASSIAGSLEYAQIILRMDQPALKLSNKTVADPD
jgi:hypothetical protein